MHGPQRVAAGSALEQLAASSPTPAAGPRRSPPGATPAGLDATRAARPGARTRGSASSSPCRGRRPARGVRRLRATLTTTAPFGPLRWTPRLPAPAALLVHPADRPRPSAARRRVGRGEPGRPAVAGAGTEVLGLRPWRPGDASRGRLAARHRPSRQTGGARARARHRTRAGRRSRPAGRGPGAGSSASPSRRVPRPGRPARRPPGPPVAASAGRRRCGARRHWRCSTSSPLSTPRDRCAEGRRRRPSAASTPAARCWSCWAAPAPGQRHALRPDAAAGSRCSVPRAAGPRCGRGLAGQVGAAVVGALPWFAWCLSAPLYAGAAWFSGRAAEGPRRCSAGCATRRRCSRGRRRPALAMPGVADAEAAKAPSGLLLVALQVMHALVWRSAATCARR